MHTAIECFVEDPEAPAVDLIPLSSDALERWIGSAEPFEASWVRAQGFDAKPGSQCSIPDGAGAIAKVLVGVDETPEPFELGNLSATLAPGTYRIAADWPAQRREHALTGFALGAYRYARYKAQEPVAAKLRLDAGDDGPAVLDTARAVYLVRDLINTPAADMLPDALADAARELAETFGARFSCLTGDELLEQGFPAIHAVGRASTCAPRLADLSWGDPQAPKVTLVGKGVCFDSGGLDIKTAAGMRLMKKDMGGAAHALGLARLIMSRALPVRLRVLVPAVENAIAGNAMRPGDVLTTRKGSSIEIDNTDAEGRVILADALWEASSERPALLTDFATLTGAARVAVGTEIAAMFCNDDALAREIEAAAERCSDPIWRLPLFGSYRKLIESKVADLSNSGSAPYAGAITAGLFLEHFVDPDVPWAHFDIMAWNVSARPGRPEGGEAMGVRAMFDCIATRFAR